MFRFLVISGAFVLPLLLEFNLRVLLFQVSDESVTDRRSQVGICVSGGLDSKTVALRLRLAGVKARDRRTGQEERMVGLGDRIGWCSCPFFVKGGHLGYGFNMLKSLR